MDWRKFDLVEYEKGRYRLERQTWGFFDWAFAFIVVALVWRFGAWLLAAGVGIAIMTGLGALLFWVSRKR